MYEYGNDPYNAPSKHGLELVGEISWSEPDYSFDLTAVWKKTRGEYYIASDSGCSCPSPFEDYTSVESLEGPFTKQSLDSRLKSMIEERVRPDSWHYGYSKSELLKQKREILGRLK